MICCVAMLLLHFGTTAPVLPQGVAGATAQAASLPGAPSAKPDCSLLASQGACDGLEANSQPPAPIPSSQPQAAETPLIPADTACRRLPWMILSAGQHGAAAFDAYSTRRAITRGAIETDPFMRPFAHSPAIYLAIQVEPVMLDIVARQMRRSHNNLWRHTWWVPQSASTAIFIFSGTHNLQFAKKRSSSPLAAW
jgi:hypothetical protein